MIFRRLSTRSILAAPPQRRSKGWRRRSALVLLLLVLTGLAGYRYVTDEARLISIASDLLHGMTGGEVSISRMDFSFFGGTSLTNVVIRAPKQSDFGPADGAGRIVCEVPGLYLEHRPLSLLLGQFRITRITAVRPRFQIVHQKATGLSNWQAMLSNRPEPKGESSQQWPTLYLRQCTLRTGTLDGKHLTFAEPVELDVLAVPAADHPGQYTCRLQPLGQDRLVRTLQADIPNGRIKGDLPGIWISQVLPCLPAQYSKWCDILELTGQVGAESIEFDSKDTARCTINLSQVGLSVPIDESEFYGQQIRARRLVRLKDVTGRIIFEPAVVSFDLSGHLNDAPCRVWGRIDGYTGPANDIGYEVHIDAQHIAIPDRSDPYVADQVRRLPRPIYKQFKQFDPTAGWVGITGCVSRPAGPDQPAKFRGVVTTDDATGYYDDFPYRGKHARSTIRCTDDGIFFTVITEREPSALFRVDGWVADSSSWTDVDVRVRGVSVPLDPEMVHALPPKFQQLLSHFEMYGLINCDFRLVRRGGTQQTGAAPWEWETTITLRDVAGRYRPFNYMQYGLCGTFSASNGVIRKIDLYAVDPYVLTTLQGRADLRDDQTSVDLRILTHNRAFTPDLLSALPEAAQQAIANAGIGGLFDADARLTMSSQTKDELECRVGIDWKNGRMAATYAPYPFYDMQGHLYADLPDNRIDIHNVTGRNGPAMVRFDGTVHTGEQVSGHFDVGLDDLPLSNELCNALPAELQQWWRSLKPQGSVSVRSIVDLPPAGTPADSTGEAPGSGTARNDTQDLRLSHKTTLLLKDNRLCWESFPLPLEGVSGTVILTDGQCELQDIVASHAGGHIRGSGKIGWTNDSTQADVKIAASNIPLDEPLREAVPWQLRKTWNEWQPAGQLSLDIDSLRYRASKGTGGTWDFEGTVSADLSRLAMAVDVTDALIKATGTAHIDEQNGTLAGRGSLEAPKAVVSLIPITNASGQWVKKADGLIRLNDFHAQSLGGTVAGSFEVEPTLQGDRYGVVLTLDKGDPSRLAQALTGGQMGGPVGTIETELRLRGLSNQPDTRNGSMNLRMEGQGLYRLPGLLQLANVLNISVPAEVPQHDAQQVTAKLTIMADKAILDSLELHDRSFIMQGTGLIDLPTRQADLTVVAARPRSWPKVPLFTEILEGTVRELVEVHGTGPMNQLKFEAKPLRSIQAALHMLSARRPALKPAKIVRPDEAKWRANNPGQ